VMGRVILVIFISFLFLFSGSFAFAVKFELQTVSTKGDKETYILKPEGQAIAIKDLNWECGVSKINKKEIQGKIKGKSAQMSMQVFLCKKGKTQDRVSISVICYDFARSIDSTSMTLNNFFITLNCKGS